MQCIIHGLLLADVNSPFHIYIKKMEVQFCSLLLKKWFISLVGYRSAIRLFRKMTESFRSKPVGKYNFLVNLT